MKKKNKPEIRVSFCECCGQKKDFDIIKQINVRFPAEFEEFFDLCNDNDSFLYVPSAIISHKSTKLEGRFVIDIEWGKKWYLV